MTFKWIVNMLDDIFKDCIYGGMTIKWIAYTLG